jgi:hypothetical protein
MQLRSHLNSWRPDSSTKKMRERNFTMKSEL